MENYKLAKDTIVRLSDNAFIPLRTANRDYQAYLKWVADGNSALPEFTPAEIIEKTRQDKNTAARLALLNIDNQTIRRMRELLVTRFPTALEVVALEAQAIIERAKIT